MNLTAFAAAVLPVLVSASTAVANPADTSEAPTLDRQQTIDEVVVFGKYLSSTAAHIDVVSEPVLDAAESLSRLPGADANANGRISGIAQFRGMYGDRVAVTIDDIGMVSGGPNAMDTPLSYVSPMITEELILERGIPGVASVPESIGGHIDARLARGAFGRSIEFGMTGMAGLRYSSNGNTHSTAARLTAADVTQRISLLVENDRSDAVETPAGRILPSSVNRDRIDVSYAYASDCTDALIFIGALDTRDTGTPALAMDIRKIETTIVGAQLGTQLTPHVRLGIKSGFNDVRHAMDNFSLRPAPVPAAQRQNDTSGEGGVYSLTSTIQFDGWSMTAGIDGRRAAHESQITNPNQESFFITNFNDVERNLQGAFVAVDFELAGNAWELGIRHNTVRTSAGQVESGGMMGMMRENADALAGAFNSMERTRRFRNFDAVARFSRPMTANLDLIVDVGTRSRAPSYQEMYLWLPLPATGGLADGYSYIGDPGLDAERSREIVAGVRWVGESLEISPRVYYRRVRNYIQGVPAIDTQANMLATMMSGRGALQFANVDARILGADVGWQFAVSDMVRLDGTAAIVNGRRTDVRDSLYRLAPANASIAINLLTAKHAVRLELVAFDSQDDVSAYNEEPRSAGYGLVNAIWTWRPRSGLKLELQAANLLDRGYQNHLAGVNRVAGSDILVGERLYGTERSLTLGAVLNF